jgi:hypothetical protein
VFSQKKTAADLVVVAFISSSYRLTFLFLWGRSFVPLVFPVLGTFVGIFFFFVLSKEKKSAHEKRKKKKPMI